MGTPILILKESLMQQYEQLSLAERRKYDYKNEKQKLFREKGIENLKGFIAEIEKAISILESEGKKQPESKDNSASHGVMQRLSKIKYWIEESIGESESFDDGVTDHDSNSKMLLNEALKLCDVDVNVA